MHHHHHNHNQTNSSFLFEISFIAKRKSPEDLAIRRMIGTHFNNYSSEYTLYQWEPTMLSSGCPTIENVFGVDKWHDAAKLLGISTAHILIWQDFYARTSVNRRNGRPSPMFVVIFENDAKCSMEGCGREAVQQMSSSQSDLMYLGWCKGSGLYIGCTHAYAISAIGVRALLGAANPCAKPIDRQIYDAVQTAKGDAPYSLFKWKLADIPEGANYYVNISKFWSKGLFVQH